MATGDIVTGSDGLPAIQIGLWAKDKLFYLKRICDIFNTGMKNKWSTRTYIDLFSGPGSCVVAKTNEEIPGSPLVALRCSTPFTHYFFNDLRPELVGALERRVSTCQYANVQYYCRDCNTAINEMLSDLPDSSLDLCFIDPLNWSINFNSIRRLTTDRKMDLVITFHTGNIRRIINTPTKLLADYFPTSDWLSRYQIKLTSGIKAERALLDIYEDGLRDIGYQYVRDHILEKNSRNARLYYIVFASKDPRGADFWDKVTTRSEAGQWRMQQI